MERRSFFKKSALAIAGFAVNPWILSRSNKESFIKEKRGRLSSKPDDIEVVVLNGTPRKRGQIHGETLKKTISEIINIWKNDLQKSHEMDPVKYIDQFLEKTHFYDAVEKWTPDLLEEVKGIAEGSGIDYKTVFALQIFEEERWYSRNKRFSTPVPEAAHCSALGVINQRGLPSLLAQNLDFSFKDGCEVLLHIKHQNSPLESFVFTFAGFIAATGMNNHAIGICCNSLLQLVPRTDGLPVSFVIRGVLNQSKYNEATGFIHNIKHATGQNYIIGGPEEIADFECSGNKVSRFIPYKGASRIYHTNHPLVNNDLDQSKFKETKIYEELLNNSEIRFKTLERRLKDPSKKITVETVKSILGSHDDPLNPVCIHKSKKTGEFGFGDTHFTAGSLIMELSDTPTLHLAPGPPCSTKYNIFKF